MFSKIKQKAVTLWHRYVVADAPTSEVYDLLDRKLKGYALTYEQEQKIRRYFYPNAPHR